MGLTTLPTPIAAGRSGSRLFQAVFDNGTPEHGGSLESGAVFPAEAPVTTVTVRTRPRLMGCNSNASPTMAPALMRLQR